MDPRCALRNHSQIEALLREPLLSWPGASPVAVREVVESTHEAGAAVLTVAAGAGSPEGSDLTERVIEAMTDAVMRTYPAWLPEAEHLAGPGGAGLAAVRAICERVAGESDLFGPFLLAAAEAALCGRSPGVAAFPRETVLREARKLILRAYGYGRLVVMVELTGTWNATQIEAAEANALWLAGPGELTVWLFGTPTDRFTRVPRASLRDRMPASDPPATPRPPYLTPLRGRPNAFSRAEQHLEAHLAKSPWATGRAWNEHLVAGGPGQLHPGRHHVGAGTVRRRARWTRPPGHGQVRRRSRARDRALQRAGFLVLRYTNDEVLDDVARVLDEIERFLEERRRPPGTGDVTMAYGIPERAVMIALMALNKETRNSELRESLWTRREEADAGEAQSGWPRPEPQAGRRKGLRPRVDGRRLGLGGRRARRDRRRARAGSAGGALYALLNGLKVALDARGMLIQELFASASSAVPEPSGSLRDRIREAYRNLASRPWDWVELRDSPGETR